MNAWVHTYTKPQTSSTRSRGLGRRIHESVEDTKLSTNKQHTLSRNVRRMFAKSEEKTSHRFGIVVLKTGLSVSRPIENSGVEWVLGYVLESN
jgi:hypothetical protein